MARNDGNCRGHVKRTIEKYDRVRTCGEERVAIMRICDLDLKGVEWRVGNGVWLVVELIWRWMRNGDPGRIGCGVFRLEIGFCKV
jgi:hypothetical protein